MRVGAGRRPAVMGAGLERDVERRAARRLAGLRQRLGLGMRAGRRAAVTPRPTISGPAARRATTSGADRRVGPGAAEMPRAERASACA